MEQSSMNSFSQRYTILLIIVVAFLTAIASEVKIIPFEGAPFRFGLGTIIFLLVVFIRPLPLIPTGIVTGIVIILFRTLLDVCFFETPFLSSITTHFPAGLFYLSYVLLLNTLKIDYYKSKPFSLASIVTFFEFISNCIEQLMTTLFITKMHISFEEILLLLLVALIRSFFAVGIYSSITVTEQKKQVKYLLNLISNLYVETLYLKKSMNEVENITANSYDLYEQLKEKDLLLSLKALSIAQEIHEIKKDGQRIYAGLSKIIKTEQLDSYYISDLLRYVKEGNEKYSDLLNKTIQIDISYNQDFRTHEHISLLALINNLVANAIEAIKDEGTIHISMNTSEELTTITVEDTGVGIPSHLLPVIFDPGYTTKYNSLGEPSTGIGLSHVQSIANKLEGKINVKSNNEKTTFTIAIPFHKLQ